MDEMSIPQVDDDYCVSVYFKDHSLFRYALRQTLLAEKNFAQFLTEKKIKRLMTTVASLWANGQIERVNRFLKFILSKIIDDHSDWNKVLGKTQFVINSTLNKTINSTPSKVFLGYDQRQSEDHGLRMMIEQLIEVDSDITKTRQRYEMQLRLRIE